MGSAAAKQERMEMLKKLQLTPKASTLAKNLSGGQKRKLCLGIALIGNAKVDCRHCKEMVGFNIFSIFCRLYFWTSRRGMHFLHGFDKSEFDKMTWTKLHFIFSGMDVEARRAIWDLLLVC